MDTLTEQIKVVHKARQRANAGRQQSERLYAEWLKENEAIIGAAVEAKQAQEEAEAKLREMTLAAYDLTGDKKPAPGVGIREVTRLEYDKTEAYEWAVKHALALQLDSKAFEKIAKAQPLPFVSSIIEAQATISPDLTEAVKEIGD